MDTSEIDALSSDQGQAMVAAVTGVDPLAARGILERAFPDADADLMRAAAAQASLAERARERFGDFASDIIWTADGLEQASRLATARHRARQLWATGVRSVTDLTVGLGLDAIAMANAGMEVVGIEEDPETAAVAAANATRLAAGHLRVVTGACQDGDLLDEIATTDAWFVDPSRRRDHRWRDGSRIRLDDPEAWSPPWSWVLEQAALVGSATNADGGGAHPWLLTVKAAPGLPHEAIEEVPGTTVSAQWASEGGQLLECNVTWVADDGRGQPASWPARSAVVLDADGEELVRIAAGPTPAQLPEPAPPVAGEYLHDPDPGIVRAGLVSELARRAGSVEAPLRLADPHLAYLVGPMPLPDSWTAAARTWRALDVGEYDPERVSAACAAHGIGWLDVTGRGRALDPERVRADLELSGEGRAGTLIVLGLGERRRSTLVVLSVRV